MRLKSNGSHRKTITIGYIYTVIRYVIVTFYHVLVGYNKRRAIQTKNTNDSKKSWRNHLIKSNLNLNASKNTQNICIINHNLSHA